MDGGVVAGAVIHGNIAKEAGMNTPLRSGIAGFVAWKQGGGLIGTIFLFLIVYFPLGRLGHRGAHDCRTRGPERATR